MAPGNIFDNRNLPMTDRILFVGNKIHCPERPLIPYFAGDSNSLSSWQACQRIVEAAVGKAYHNSRSISWVELLAGQKAQEATGEWLPDQSLSIIKDLGIAIFGSLPEALASGIRSRLRKALGLSFQLRPIGNPCEHLESNPLLIEAHSTEHDFEICLENDSPTARALGEFLHLNGAAFSKDSNFHIEAFSERELKELINLGLHLSSSSANPCLTIVHGHRLGQSADSLFSRLSHKLIDQEFRQKLCSEKELSVDWAKTGKTLLRHMLFEDFLLDFRFAKPAHNIIISNPLFTDFLFASLASQTEMLGLAPRQLLGTYHSVFCCNSQPLLDNSEAEFTNPLAMIFTACQMLDFISWTEAAQLIKTSLKRAVEKKLLSLDPDHVKRPSKMRTAEYATVIIDNIVKA